MADKVYLIQQRNESAGIAWEYQNRAPFLTLPGAERAAALAAQWARYGWEYRILCYTAVEVVGD